MTALRWTISARLVGASLGRLTLPRARMRYRDGYVRVGRGGPDLIVTLEDAHGVLQTAPSWPAAARASARLGKAVSHFLQQHNRYQAGESVGQSGQVRVAV